LSGQEEVRLFADVTFAEHTVHMVSWKKFLFFFGIESKSVM
jgi:hypothetical protein